MTPEELERVAELFEQARQLPVEARSEFLAAACTETPGVREQVESLLAEHGAGGGAAALGVESSWRAALSADREAEAARASSTAGLPGQIGGYEVVARIGEGGMGVVYEAEQKSPRRRVAVKVIRSGLVTEAALRRFRVESEVLAWLEHPGIAQVFEAGTALLDGVPLPFFAMELVRGRPLVDYAKEQKLDDRQRIELIVKVCDAVEHAHRKGVVHRDLKPGNILVNETGQPKILDFGLARIADSRRSESTPATEAGQLLGTLLYMSPEQLEGDPSKVDTRSDVYAIGVMLFELLGGRLPHDVERLSFPQAIQRLASAEPTRLASIDPRFRGDVDAIACKALERERERRYQSATDLSLDLRRHLDDEPVSARHQTTFYQLKKFAKRNKALVGGVSAALIAIVVGSAVAIEQMLVANRERDKAVAANTLANARLEEARSMTRFLRDVISSVDPERDGRDARVLDVIDRTAPRIDVDLAGKTAAQAGLHDAMGMAYYSLGQYAKADEQLQKSLGLWGEAPRAEPQELGDVHHNLALLRMKQGNYDAARSEILEALSLERQGGREKSPSIASSLMVLAQVDWLAGRLDSSESVCRQGLAMRRELYGGDHPDIVTAIDALAETLKYRGKSDEAKKLMEEGLEMGRRIWRTPHFGLVGILQASGTLLRELGDIPEARKRLEEALEVSRKILGVDHPDLAHPLSALAELLMDVRELDGAEKLLDEALEISRKAHGNESREVSNLLTGLGYLAYRRSDIATFERLAREALDMRRRLLGERDRLVAQSLYDVGICLEWNHHTAEAISHFQQAIEIFRESVSKANPEVANCLHTLGAVLLRNGDAAAGIPHLREALAMERELTGPESPASAQNEFELAGALLQTGGGNLEEIQTMAEHALAVQGRVYGTDDPDYAIGLQLVGNVFQKQKKLDLAYARFKDAIAIHQKTAKEGDRELNIARRGLGGICLEMGRLEEAEECFTKSFPALLKAMGASSPGMQRLLEDIERLYGALKQPEKAEKFRRMLNPSTPSATDDTQAPTQ
jgi:tetratricopeptide (TPR) repeat protein/predicted Ser/Thr protein kinase